MKYLKPIYNFLNEEALPLNLAKEYVSYGEDRPSWLVDKLNELFDNQQRVYIPIDETTKGQTQIKVEQALLNFGYTIKDYKLGIAFQTDNPKREIRIGKLLQKEKQTDLLKMFNEDTNRTLAKQQAEYSIVICQHPYDIAGMSCGREWSNSCLNILGGVNKHYVPDEIASGTITVYYIKSSDRNINNPIGRINVKLYSEDVDDTLRRHKNFPSNWVWIPDTRVYGNFPTNALKLLYSWLSERQDYTEIYNSELYKLNGLYNYSGTAYVISIRIEDGILKNIYEEWATEEDYNDYLFGNEDEDDDTDWNDIDMWEGELSGMRQFLSHSENSDIDEFRADRDGIDSCRIDIYGLVIDKNSSTYYNEFPRNFRIGTLYDSLTIDFTGCIKKGIWDYVYMGALDDTTDVTIENETFDSGYCNNEIEECSHLTDKQRSDIMRSLGKHSTITLKSCDKKSVQSTLKEYFEKFPTTESSPILNLNDCDDYFEYLSNVESVEDLEGFDINFLLEWDLAVRISTDGLIIENVKVYNDLTNKYSELLKIEDIFEYYNFSGNDLVVQLQNDDFFEGNIVTHRKFKHTELFDSLKLDRLKIIGYSNYKPDLSTLPKAFGLELMDTPTMEDLTGLRQKSYDRVEIKNCSAFKSPKGLSLKNPNNVNSFNFDRLNYPDFTFFDELVELYPAYLEELKMKFKGNPNGNYYINLNGWKKVLDSGDAVSPTYGNIIKYLEKVSDEDWLKTEDGINDFLSKVVKNGKWIISDNGKVSIFKKTSYQSSKCEVDLSDMNLTEIPIKFNVVDGEFRCTDNKLTTLKNCPNYVESLYCSNNQLTSLEFAPSNIEKGFYCDNNLLKDLKGMRNCGNVLYTFSCRGNQLTSLEGVTKKVKFLWVSHNNLTSFKGLENIDVDFLSSIDCRGNQLTSLEGIPSKIGATINLSDQKNGKRFTKEEVKMVTNVETIYL